MLQVSETDITIAQAFTEAIKQLEASLSPEIYPELLRIGRILQKNPNQMSSVLKECSHLTKVDPQLRVTYENIIDELNKSKSAHRKGSQESLSDEQIQQGIVTDPKRVLNDLRDYCTSIGNKHISAPSVGFWGRLFNRKSQ
jgi:hypothetical protein